MRRAPALLLLALAACAEPAPAPPPPVAAITPQSENSVVIATTVRGVAETIPGRLVRPTGTGPFPAVVILHDCSGLGTRSSGAPGRWARELAARGFMVLLPDSFSTRGFPNGVCIVPAREHTPGTFPSQRAVDAYAALDYLRSLREVDGNRVGVMGGSHGGSSTLWTMAAPVPGGPLAAAKQRGFAAGVALYPGCYNVPAWQVTRANGNVGPITAYAGTYKTTGPLLILSGEKDDWTPAEPCRRMAAAAEAAGQPVRIKVYPDAHHSFDSANPVRYVDSRTNSNNPDGHGATTGGDPTAWADAIKEVDAFFDQHLKAR